MNAIAPEGFEEHGPFDVILELVGAPNLAGERGRAGQRGRIGVIGVGAGATSELDLRGLMGKREHPRLDVRAARSRTRRPPRAASSVRCSRASRPAT